MKILQKLAQAGADPGGTRAPTIAFLGDSVTHGVFEIGGELTFDFEMVYHAQLKRLLSELYPASALNIINAGISGGGAPAGALRLERDVLSHRPDLTVVCFGLNDVHAGKEGIGKYLAALSDIFDRLLASGSEVIFLTPNMMNSVVSRFTDAGYEEIAARCAHLQTDGTMDAYIDAARALCDQKGIPLCDCYALWTSLSTNGVNTTALLANHINHPSRTMHSLFAHELLKTMFFRVDDIVPLE